MFGRIRRATRFLKDAEAAYTSAPRRPQRSLARDAVLALLVVDGGRRRTKIDYAVTAALMGELVQEGRLTVSEEGKKTRVDARDDTPTGDPDLDDALVTIASGMFGQRVTWLARSLPPAYSQLCDRLVKAGQLVEEPHRTLGLFPTTRHHPTPTAQADELVATVRSVLLGHTVPDARTAVLVCALDIIAPPREWVDKPDVKAARERVRVIRDRLPDQERTLVDAVLLARTSSESGYSGA